MSKPEDVQEKTNGKNDQELTITIQTTQGNWPDATFNKTQKVADVIKAVVTHFSFSTNGNYKLKIKGSNDFLEPERPLISYGIQDGAILVLTDIGTGA